ncbi:MAG: YkgJ family cysteine cluster protein [Bacteroidota bacterium]
MNTTDKNVLTHAKSNFKLNQKILLNLKRKKSNMLDFAFHTKHESEFKKMDCLTCANCCKTTSPIFRDSDIRRISKHLKIKESKLINDLLRMDEDEDYVLRTSPCYFLNSTNSCSIYEFRPLACREYPHTNRKNMSQILNLTIKNSLICPVVSRIISQIVVSEQNK